MRPALFSLFLTVLCAFAQSERCVFYPTVIRTGENILAIDKMTHDDCSWATFTVGKGSPFSHADNAWSVAASQDLSAYWRTSAKIQPGHKYLTGAWVRFSNAKILFWNYGQNTQTNKRWQKRLYCFGGFSKRLIPYLSEQSMKNLLHDPDEWILCYRILTADEPLEKNLIKSHFGLYMAIGAMTFSTPFFIDVTELSDASLTIDIQNSPKPIAKLTIIDTANGDAVWTKRFDTPVSSFTEAVGGGVDFRTYLEDSSPKGYSLFITYMDGTNRRLSAPQGGIFTSRE